MGIIKKVNIALTLSKTGHIPLWTMTILNSLISPQREILSDELSWLRYHVTMGLNTKEQVGTTTDIITETIVSLLLPIPVPSIKK